MKMNTVIIIGAGQGGVSLAKALKQDDAAWEKIIIFDSAQYGLYAKVRLPEFIAGRLPEQKMILSDAASLKKLGIETHFQESITNIDRTERFVETSSGKKFAYDILVFATGAKAAIPDVEGLNETKNVKTLRTFNDAFDIIKLADASKNALVMGGGLLGLEAAWALKERGLEVTVFEYMPRLLPRQLDEKQSARLYEKLISQGYKIELAASASSVCNSCEGGVEVKLSDGRILNGDMMIVSAGIAPEIALARQIGLECGRAIKVLHSLRTSDPKIYAVGDCAEIDGRTQGLWMAAKDQGEAAAAIIAGRASVFNQPSYAPRLKMAGIDFNEIKNA